MTVKLRSETFFFGLLFAVLMGVQIFFGARKQGFHEDEFYSYYSSNRTAGLYTPDGTWVDTSLIRDELVVLPGEGFRFSLVRQVQSWDVHPPLYYLALHTVCSFFPGVFSKWTGLALNLAAFFSSLILLERIAKRLSVSFGGRLFLLSLYGLNAATVSVNMFLRMYAWLNVWVLLALLLHLRLWQEGARGDAALTSAADSPKRQTALLLVWIALCDLCGFLTHYYYLVFLFFLVIVMLAGMLWRRKKETTQSPAQMKCILWLLLSHAAGMLIAVLYYPYSLAHILRGYRGKEAAEAFFSLSNLAERAGFFFGITRRNLFYDGRIAGALILGLLMILPWKVVRKKKEAGADKSALIGIGVCIAGYFAVIAKTALMLGDTSIRYLSPVCPLLWLLIGAGIDRLIQGWRLRGILYGYVLFVAVLGLSGDRVLFLYPENAERIAFDDAHAQSSVVVAFYPETPHNVWRIADHLLRFDEVFFVEEGAAATVTDTRVLSADERLVFAADAESRDALLRQLCAGLSDASPEEVWQREMWTLFYVR